MSAVLISLGSGVRVYCESDSSVDCKTCRNDSVYGGADICVTTLRVLKMNHHLDMMERVAEELKELSDKLGENIYENVMEQHERAEKLREKYTELAKTSTHLGSRFVKAFPKMQSRRHQDLLE